MEHFELAQQIVIWSLLALSAIALCVAIAWPRVKGKTWLVVYLLVGFLQGLYFRIIDVVASNTAAEHRVELYERFETVNFLVLISIFVAHVILVVGLFRLRSFLSGSVALESTAQVAHAVSTAPARTSWPAKGGTSLGSYRVNGGSTFALAGAMLSLHDDDSVIVSGKYDPPGSALYALLATIVSVVGASVMLAALGFAAAPGWLVWYIIIVLIRRRRISIDVGSAESIVIDPTRSRIAVRAPFGGRDRWVALKLLSDFHSAEKALSAAFPQKVRQGKVANPSTGPMFLLIALILVLLAVIIITALGALSG